VCPGCRRRVTGACPTCDRAPAPRANRANRQGYGRRESQRRADTVAAWIAQHGWVCPGWERDSHPATDLSADHDTPIALGGPQGGPLSVLCKSCNSARGAKLPTPTVAGLSVTLVSGPPCGGKSSYLATYAKPSDLIVDYDALAIALRYGASSHEHVDVHKPFICEARDAVLDRLMLGNHGVRQAWIVNAGARRSDRNMYRRRYGAEVIVVLSPEDVCLRRAASQRPGDWHRYVKSWFNTYEPDPADVVVRGYDPEG
jgi:hypothetical protein